MEDKNKENLAERKRAMIDFSQLARLIVRDLSNKQAETSFFKKYNKDDVRKYLENPDKFEKELRSMSRFLYNVSPHYRRLINYFAKMLLFNYTVEPYGLNTEKVNAKTFKIAYKKAADFLDIIDFKHEFQKILTIAFREDVFYGYEYKNDDSFFVQKLNSDFCKISSIEDGCYNFAFDFSYFDRDTKKLDNYDNEFRDKYNAYLKDKTNLRWQELDSTRTLCIKINEDLDYVFPIFASTFESLYDIQDYKSLKKAKTELDNYKILVMELPLKKDSDMVNDFLVDLDLATQFYNKAAQSLPDQVGLVLSPTKVEGINLGKDTTLDKNVEESEEAFWSGAGVTSSMFNSKANSGAVLNKAIITDEEISLSVLAQVQRWVNRKLKVEINGAYKFRAEFLEMTKFNQDEVKKSYLEAAQYGVPIKTRLASAYGLTPATMLNMLYLENDLLKLHEKFIPLASSHTQSSNDKGGNPGKGDNTEGKTEAGNNIDANNPDNRA